MLASLQYRRPTRMRFAVSVESWVMMPETDSSVQKSVTLEEIDSAESLAANLEKIELPDHLAAVLVDPLMQKFMMLRQDKDKKRIWSWMGTQMAEILNGDADDETVADTLRVMVEYARISKVRFFPTGLSPLYAYRRAGYRPLLSCRRQIGRAAPAPATRRSQSV